MKIWQLPSVLLLLISSVISHPHNLFEYNELSEYVDSHQEEYVQTLRDWVAVESDSSDVLKRPDCHRMMDMTAEKLRAMGGKVELVDIGVQEDLPVNVKFIIEGMEETGSNGLDAMIMAQRDSFLSDVDYILISDCGWLSRRPALTYGTRGNCYFFAEVEGPKQDLHSGVYGGTVIEPMTDLIGILDTLISPSGKILIPGIREAVAPLSDEEWKMYQDIEFDIESYKSKIGVSQLMYNNKVDLLAHRWRYPTVTVHGIEGAFSAPGTKTVIPAKVIAKFSIRQVPNMDPAVVKKQVTDYLNSVFAKRKSPNKLKVTMVIGAKPWLADTKHPLYEAGKAAVKRVFNVEPDLIREGGTIPIAKTFEDVTGKSIIMLPIGGFDDGLHSQNEKMSRYNYIEGTKLFIAYLHEVAHLKKN
uniref:Peptidase M20 dimerisation domain-containing protein n=1 Tax=Esox lucius TaxID=8010 RepID=A0AAY5KIP3_ESOLU